MDFMLDIKFIREHADEVKDAAKKKNLDPKVIDEVLDVDKRRREIMTKLESIRAEQKKTKDRETGTRLKEEFKKVSEESGFDELEKKFRELMVRVPNIISSDTPVGKDI
jgi:seryl-tRNA synthetase